MMKTRILSTEDLKPYIQDSSASSLLNGLYKHQQHNWPLLAQGIKGLEDRKEKCLEMNGDTITVQFNPARIKSIAANVDPNVVKARTCFLCIENLPPEQTGVLIEKDLIALTNPMPVFLSHFTFAHIQHKAQDIVGNIESLLKVSQKLSGTFTVFFNGALAGASAPDHFHYQACPRNTLPVTAVARNKKESLTNVGTILSVEISTVSFFGNKYIALKSPSLEDLVSVLERLIYLFDNNHPCGKDMLNIIAEYDESTGWQIVFIPREKHRPDCFYEEGRESLLISPGSVEMCGVIITAREEDFNKITTPDVQNILAEVTLNSTAYGNILNSLFKI